jgi:hypothetical protein
VGIVQNLANNYVYLVVPKTRWTPQQRIKFKLAETARFNIKADDLKRVRPGDKVLEFKGDTMANGAFVIREISIELSDRRPAATVNYTDLLYQKFSYLSDDPLSPRIERSEHFLLQTDISAREARVLLAKLEATYSFLSRYYHRRLNEAIECFVVRDVQQFAGRLPPLAIEKIEQQSGLTIAEPGGVLHPRFDAVQGKRSIVYSCDDQAIVQHEAVHAFCNLAFGTVGPVWYAEGMAEMGQYFEPDQLAVRLDPVVIEYLTTARKKSMHDIIQDGQFTGDSWKDYAWRWALCHLLCRNPNYSQRFRNMGANLLQGKTNAFEKVFGNQAERIAFEYEQFVFNLDNGYRADLCAWDWNTSPAAVVGPSEFIVNSRAGWQSTGLLLEENTRYDFVCPKIKDGTGNPIDQTWQIDPNRASVTAEGDRRGQGMLIGAILSGYELSEPFEIGARSSGFSPPQSGQLYVRCREKWNAIENNAGHLRIAIRVSPE